MPIITRSQEGLIVPELGAGGAGGGDLHQIPELELSYLGPAREFEELCKRFTKDEDHLARILSEFESASKSRNPKMSLNGLEIEVDKEISSQEFLKRLLALKKVKPASHGDHAPHTTCLDGGPVTDTIHFPFSRHSSYNELCDLIALFRPGDIYPCTVEEQTWTEDVSMKTLFGHLCSGTVFSHDEKMRLRLLERLENEGPPKKRHRTRNTEESQASNLVENESQGNDDADEMQAPTQNSIRSSRQPIHAHVLDEKGEGADQSQYITNKFVAVKAVYDAHMERAIADSSVSPSSDEDEEIREPASPSASNQASESQISISESVFESQSQSYVDQRLQIDRTCDDRDHSISQGNVVSLSELVSDQRKRRSIREEAYRAARLTLQTSDSGIWDDLGIRSLGNKGHCDPEEEL